MRLDTEIAGLEDHLRSMEKDKAPGQKVWGYVTSFFPGGVSRLEEQRLEWDRQYRDKIAVLRIRETEKTRRLVETQACKALVESYYRQVSAIESEITRKEEKELKAFHELTKMMADRMKSEYRTKAQQRTQYTPRTVTCEHRAWWDRVEGCFRCSRCTKAFRRFAFKCPGCEKIACALCRDVLKRKYD